MKKSALLFVFTLFLGSCSQNIEPIRYGEEACAFCSMTIVDQSHSAQIVTEKGKNYKFDSSECMIQYLDREMDAKDVLHVLTANYYNPGELVNAKRATFLVSENIPSPMGAFLSAVENEEDADKLQSESGGELYTWEEIQQEILKNFSN